MKFDPLTTFNCHSTNGNEAFKVGQQTCQTQIRIFGFQKKENIKIKT